MRHSIKNYDQADPQIKLHCLRFYKWALEHQIASFRMVIADDTYYQRPLEERRDILGAPAINFLCKTIIFENTAYDQKFTGPFYPKYLAVMVQYVAKIHTQKLNKVLKLWQHSNCETKAAKSYFHYRLVENSVSDKLTGYSHNGVIPVMMKTQMPIVFSHEIEKLVPQFFWMGGGHPQIKMRLSFQDFKATYPDKLFVEDITY